MDNQKDTNADHSPDTLFPKDFLRIEERTSFYNLAVQKAEKISTALYIITNHIEQAEPIRKEVRNEATGLVLKTISLEDPEAGDDFLFRSLDISITTTLSLLKVGTTIGFITEGNFQILERELTKLKAFFAFGQKFYAAKNFDAVLKSLYHDAPEQVVELPPKRHIEPVSNKTPAVTPTPNKRPEQKKEEVKIPKQVSKLSLSQGNSRRDQIVRLIRDKGEVGIKDISESFSDCSEKTIQREINALIEDGVVSKTGERRWSRYSLK